MAVQRVSNQPNFKGLAIPINIWQKNKKLMQITHQINEMKIVKNSDLKVYVFETGVTVKKGKLHSRGLEAAIDSVFHPDALVSATKRAIRQFYKADRELSIAAALKPTKSKPLNVFQKAKKFLFD